MNKPSEAIRHFEEMMRSPRSYIDTSRLGDIEHHSSTKKENHPRVERKK